MKIHAGNYTRDWSEIVPIPQSKPDTMTDREWTVLQRRLRGDTLQSIGDDLGVTATRIRQIEYKGVLRLRRAEKTWHMVEASRQARRHSGERTNL